MQTDFRQIAREKATKYGLLPAVFERQIEVESGFNPARSSAAGAQGIAQIMPGTAREWGVNANDPVASLDAAAKNMSGYIKTYLGGVRPSDETDPAKLRAAYEKGLRAYNAGPGAVDASKGYTETNQYVKKIIDPDTFSFTEALKNKQPQTQLSSAGLPSTPTTTTPTSQQSSPANTYNFYLNGTQQEGMDFLSTYLPKLTGQQEKPKSMFDPLSMLASAFNTDYSKG